MKCPVVKISDVADSGVIIEAGVREFLDTYKDKVYPGGLTAKLGIYCGTIEKLEELVYPLVSRVVAEYGLPSDVILKFHSEFSEFYRKQEVFLEDKQHDSSRGLLSVHIHPG